MKLRHAGLVFAAAMSVLPPALAAQQSQGLSSADARVVDSIVTAAMKTDRLVGISLAVVQHGRLVLAKGYGLSSLAPNVPVDTTTRFSIGSVTKEFVSAVVLLLQEDGKLSVHDKVAKYFPNLTRASDITVLDLMNHVSGYRDYYPLDFVDREMAKPVSANEIMREYATRPLDFDPGTRWSYSNTGYTVLGAIAERASGRPLGTLLQERIFGPLGMRQTFFEPQPGATHLAVGYNTWALGEHERATPEALGWRGAAGGIWSTAADLTKWDLALIRRGFLSPSSRDVLFGPRALKNGINTGYAAGLGVRQAGGRTIYSHGGATSGFSATNIFTPDDSAAVVVLSNYDRNVPAGPIFDVVAPKRPNAEVAMQQSSGARREQEPMPIPVPKGSGALQEVLEFFSTLQHGTVERAHLSDDYAFFLTPARLEAARRSLGPLGEPTRAEITGEHERGGLQVVSANLTFPSRKVTVSMYRAPDGKVEQYLLW